MAATEGYEEALDACATACAAVEELGEALDACATAVRRISALRRAGAGEVGARHAAEAQALMDRVEVLKVRSLDADAEAEARVEALDAEHGRLARDDGRPSVMARIWHERAAVRSAWRAADELYGDALEKLGPTPARLLTPGEN